MATFAFNNMALHATQPKLHSMFCALFLKIIRRAYYCLAISELGFVNVELFLGGAVNDKYYADKPETIDALKDNIPETIAEVQLHTIDNVLKNWTDRIIKRKDCTFK